MIIIHRNYKFACNLSFGFIMLIQQPLTVGHSRIPICRCPGEIDRKCFCASDTMGLVWIVGKESSVCRMFQTLQREVQTPLFSSVKECL